MEIREITFDIHVTNFNQDFVYRVYVDNDLITERTWIWHENQIFIREHVWVNLEPGKHTVEVITPTVNLGKLSFKVLNHRLDGKLLKLDHNQFELIE